MTPFLRTAAPLLVTLAILCAPLIVGAQANSSNTTPPANWSNSTPPANTSGGTTYSIENPLKVSNFCDLLKIILEAALLIGMPIAVLFLVWVGFKFIAAQGSDDKLRKAKNSLLHTVIGIAIFLGAWTIATVIAKTLEQLGAPGVGSCVGASNYNPNAGLR